MKEFIAQLTWVDCVALLAVLRGVYVGYRSGFFPELLRIAAYLATAIVSFRFHDALTQFLTLNTFLNEATAAALAAVLLIAGTYGLAKLVMMIVLRLLKIGEGAFIQRLLGALLGVARWTLLVSLLFMAVDALPLFPLKADIHERSLTGPAVSRVAPLLFDFLSNLSPQLGVTQRPS